MKWAPYAGAMLCTTPIASYASVYMTVEQAQKLMLPAVSLQKVAIHLSDEQAKNLKKASCISYPLKTDQVYKGSDGSWFIVDQALGKHEMITYAVAIAANGAIKQVEVLEYNESYGAQVHEAAWVQQFVGKTSTSALTLGKDIRNISGATLSSKHLTESIKRILQFHAQVLKSLKS